MKFNVLIVDDERAICDSLSFGLEDHYHIFTTTDPEESLRILQEKSIDLILLDLRIGTNNGIEVLQKMKQICPSVMVIMMTAYASIETSVEATKQGAYYYIEKPINIEKLLILMERALKHKQMSQEIVSLHRKLKQKKSNHPFLGKSKAMQHVFSMIDRIKDIDSSVLIFGESGTGKELVARNIHNIGKRKNGPMQIVNCAAIPETLLESELFGYEKGAFTGATQRKDGKWLAANGGTLFLDEVSEIAPSLQGKLLRVLQEREITPLGSNKTISVDVRIISASNKKLEELVREGKFRQDLFFRLNVIPLDIPSLRERKEDLPILIDYYLEKYSREMNKEIKSISPEAKRLLLDYTYPGNVRELGNIMEYTVALSMNEMITISDLPNMIQKQNSLWPEHAISEKNSEKYLTIPIGLTMKEIERYVIKKTLVHCNMHKQRTAQTLQISERNLRDKIKLYEIIDKK